MVAIERSECKAYLRVPNGWAKESDLEYLPLPINVAGTLLESYYEKSNGSDGKEEGRFSKDDNEYGDLDEKIRDIKQQIKALKEELDKPWRD